MTPILTTTPASRRSLRLALTLLIVLAGAGAGVHLNALAGAPAAKRPPNPGALAADTAAVPHRVVATYFHTTYRCASCRKIGAYTKEAIEAGFPEALRDGRLVWQEINFETKGNEHFVKDYKLYTKALILVDQRSGRPDEWKNLTKIWELLGDREEFVKYVQAETRAYLDRP